MNYRQEIQRNREYWDAVLGERICAKILAEGFPDEREDSDICQEEPEALSNGMGKVSLRGDIREFLLLFRKACG